MEITRLELDVMARKAMLGKWCALKSGHLGNKKSLKCKSLNEAAI